MSDLGGKVKDAVGGLTDDTSLQAEGNVDQATADAQQATGQLGGKAQDAAQAAVDEVKAGRGVVHTLHAVGLRSEYAYAGAFASIGLSLASWFISRNKKGDDKAQSDRWGIFIGHWAPRSWPSVSPSSSKETDRRFPTAAPAPSTFQLRLVAGE